MSPKYHPYFIGLMTWIRVKSVITKENSARLRPATNADLICIIIQIIFPLKWEEHRFVFLEIEIGQNTDFFSAMPRALLNSFFMYRYFLLPKLQICLDSYTVPQILS